MFNDNQIFFASYAGLDLYQNNYPENIPIGGEYDFQDTKLDINDIVLFNAGTPRTRLCCDLAAFRVQRYVNSPNRVDYTLKPAEKILVADVDIFPYLAILESKAAIRFTATTQQLKDLALNFLCSSKEKKQKKEVISSLASNRLWLDIRSGIRGVFNPKNLLTLPVTNVDEVDTSYRGYLQDDTLGFFWLSNQGNFMSAIPYTDISNTFQYKICCNDNPESSYQLYCVENLSYLEDEKRIIQVEYT